VTDATAADKLPAAPDGGPLIGRGAWADFSFNALAKTALAEKPVPTLLSMSRTRRLIVVLVLNLGLVTGLVAVGVTAHSIAVLAEGGDYLLDAAGVGVALLAIRLAARPATRARPEGYPNATTIAALVNAGWLLILELLVAAAALDRLVTGRVPVDGLAVLVVSGVAAVVMLASALVLRGDENGGDGEEKDLSVAAVLLDTVADAAAAAGVAAVGTIILATGGWYWLDPVVALVIAIVVAYYALALLRKVLGRRRPATVSHSE
jgi:cobalt-zinc-cadmium efflux system protein